MTLGGSKFVTLGGGVSKKFGPLGDLERNDGPRPPTVRTPDLEGRPAPGPGLLFDPLGLSRGGIYGGAICGTEKAVRTYPQQFPRL